MAGTPKTQPAEQAARTAAKNAPEVTDPKARAEMQKMAEEARLQKELDKGYAGATGGKAKGGAVKKMARGGGVEIRGKTKGRIV